MYMTLNTLSQEGSGAAKMGFPFITFKGVVIFTGASTHPLLL